MFATLLKHAGFEYLKDVVVNDKLGIAEELEAQMQHIVDTYQDEWATVVQVNSQCVFAIIVIPRILGFECVWRRRFVCRCRLREVPSAIVNI